MPFDQDENTKTKRLQSANDLSGAGTPSGSVHGRQITAGVNAPEASDQEDGSSYQSTTQLDVLSNKSAVASNIVTIGQDIVAESLEKLMSNKIVREKKNELDKKLESLRRKHEKEKLRVQSSKTSLDGEKHKSKFYNNKLVKRLSTKNM